MSHPLQLARKGPSKHYAPALHMPWIGSIQHAQGSTGSTQPHWMAWLAGTRLGSHRRIGHLVFWSQEALWGSGCCCTVHRVGRTDLHLALVQGVLSRCPMDRKSQSTSYMRVTLIGPVSWDCLWMVWTEAWWMLACKALTLTSRSSRLCWSAVWCCTPSPSVWVPWRKENAVACLGRESESSALHGAI